MLRDVRRARSAGTSGSEMSLFVRFAGGARVGKAARDRAGQTSELTRAEAAKKAAV